MSVTYDNSVTVDDFGVTTLTSASFTVTANADRAIIGGLSTFDLTTLHSMTLAGQTGTAITNASLIWNAATCRMVMFGAAAPNTGSQTVSASWTLAASASLGGLTAYGVDQTTPLNNGGNITDGSPTSLAMTSPSGDMSVTLASNSNVSTTHSSNQTVRTTDWGKLDTKTTISGANPTHTWSQAATDIGIIGANFVAAGAAAGATHKLMLIGVGF